MNRIQIHLRDDQLEELRRVRGERGITIAESVRRAVDFYFKSDEYAFEFYSKSKKWKPKEADPFVEYPEHPWMGKGKKRGWWKEAGDAKTHGIVGVGVDVFGDIRVCERSQPAEGECAGADDD
jgi:hypothetical protein